LEVVPTKLEGVLIVEPEVFGDARGYFMESYHAARYAEAGIASTFVQDNLSRSSKGVLRGLHFQHPHPQAKLVSVMHGAAFDVAVDIRAGSPTFGQWMGVKLSRESNRQLYLPEGIAHGFCALQDDTLIVYKCSDYYHPEYEWSVLWNDPHIGIDWPIASPKVSSKDRQGKLLKDFPPEQLPKYRSGGTYN